MCTVLALCSPVLCVDFCCCTEVNNCINQIEFATTLKQALASSWDGIQCRRVYITTFSAGVCGGVVRKFWFSPENTYNSVLTWHVSIICLMPSVLVCIGYTSRHEASRMYDMQRADTSFMHLPTWLSLSTYYWVRKVYRIILLDFYFK